MRGKEQELFALALDYYRAPMQSQSRVDGIDFGRPDFSAFLEILNKPESSENQIQLANSLSAAPKELREAALFLVKQLLFREGADYYQVLGLVKESSSDDIRRRYRQLIALFHPDRNPEGEAWDQLYASRINEAYNTLKKGDKRRAYDRTLGGPEHQEESVAAASPADATASVSHPSQRERPSAHYSVSPTELLYRFSLWQRHPKLVVWGGLSVVLITLFLFLSLQHQAPLVKRTSQPAADATKEMALLANDGFFDQAQQAQGRVDGKHEMKVAEAVEANSAATQNVAVKDEKKIVKNSARLQAKVDKGILQQQISEMSHKAPLKKGRQPIPQQVPISQPEEAVLQGPEKAPDDELEVPPSVEAVVAIGEEQDAGVQELQAVATDTKGQLEFMLGRYVSAYESGDLAKLLSLCAPWVRTKDGVGIDNIKKDYGQLFAVTEERRIVLNNLRWVRKNAYETVVDLNADIQVVKKSGSDIEHHKGEMRFRFLNTGNEIRIAELVHDVKKIDSQSLAVSGKHAANTPESSVPLEMVVDEVIQGEPEETQQQKDQSISAIEEEGSEAVDAKTSAPQPEAERSGEIPAEAETWKLGEKGYEMLLGNYVVAYEAGDLEKLVSLFTPQVKTDEGEGVHIIERDYGNLFKNTASRRMAVNNIKLEPVDKREARIEMHVSIQVLKEEGGVWDSFAGTMNLGLYRMQDRLFISEHMHDVKKQ